MNKQNMSSKLKFAEQQTPQIFPTKRQQQTNQPHLTALQQKLCEKNFTQRSKIVNLIARCVNRLPSQLRCSSILLSHVTLKLQICIFLNCFGIVCAAEQTHSTTWTAEGDLLVCVSQNNTKPCTKYVNSSIYGLIKLNESIYPGLKMFRGNYDYQMIARVNPFWLGFEPPNDVSYYVMAILYMVIFVVGISGNGLVIYMFAKCKALRTVSNILVFNLALCDFMIVAKCPIAVYNNYMRGPVLGGWACRLYGFVGGFSGSASIGMLTVISIDRYTVVVNPLNPLHLKNRFKYYYCLLSLVWLEAFFFSVIPLVEVGLSVYVPEGYLTTCSFDYLDKTMPARIFMFLFFVFAWCLPLAIICYCYFHILRSVMISKTIQSSHNKHQLEVRLAFIILLVIGLWFLAWTPYSIVAMMGVFGWEKYLTPTISMIPALFCKTAACLNPLLYTISHKRFRNELQRLFCKRRPIYRYSATRFSYLASSSRRLRNHCDEPTSDLSSFKTKAVKRNATFDGIVQSSLYGADASVFHHRMLHRKSSFSNKQLSPVISMNNAEIFILECNNFEDLKTPPLETNF